MQHLKILKAQTPQKTAVQGQSSRIQNEMFGIYEMRMKSLMEIVKAYQENIQIDNQTGALAFMKTQQMASYRIDRQFELLKDALLTEKQKLVIKVLTSCQLLKKQNELLTKQNQNQKFSFTKNPDTQAAQKDQNQRAIVSKQVSLNRISEKIGNSMSRISNISNSTGEQHTSNISIYEKLLQDKLALIKELEKKNKFLVEQNELGGLKLNQLKILLQKASQSQLKQCVSCKQLSQVQAKISNQVEILKGENERNKMKIKEDQILKNIRQQQLKLKDCRIKELELRAQNAVRQMLVKQEQCRKQEQLKKQNQFQQEMLRKQKQDAAKIQSSKSKAISNLHTITQLKSQILTLEQQLMSIGNQFSLIKQDISQSLHSEISKLRNANTKLKNYITQSLINIRGQIMAMVLQMARVIKEKIDKKGRNQDMVKKLKELDNQIDFFMEQRQIHA